MQFCFAFQRKVLPFVSWSQTFYVYKTAPYFPSCSPWQFLNRERETSVLQSLWESIFTIVWCRGSQESTKGSLLLINTTKKKVLVCIQLLRQLTPFLHPTVKRLEQNSLFHTQQVGTTQMLRSYNAAFEYRLISYYIPFMKIMRKIYDMALNKHQLFFPFLQFREQSQED